jgi:mannosyltransferase OCH1-like enzyme
MIPKIIHYCWLSGDPIPAEYQKCMESWKEKLIGYEFMLWDTKRFDIHSALWTQQTFEDKHYASAADYIRLYGIYHFGGIYLDMDVEAVKPFDDLLNSGLLLARENHVYNYIEAGCFGAEKGHPFIKKCLDWFDVNAYGGRGQLILPQIMYAVWKESFADAHVYSRDYFTAKNVMTGKIEKTQNTYTIHHFATKWVTPADRLERAVGWKIYSTFGETLFSDIVFTGIKRTRACVRRIKQKGLFNALRYYLQKYRLHNINKESNK